MYTDSHHNNADVIQDKKTAKNEVSELDIDFSVRETRNALTHYSTKGSKIHFVPLSPPEKGFFTGVEGGIIDRQVIHKLYECLASNDQEKVIAWMNSHFRSAFKGRKSKDLLLKTLPLHLTLPRIAYLQNGHYDYFEELKKQYKFYLDGEPSGNYSIIQSGEEINVLTQDERSCSSVVFCIDGIHSLGIGNPEDEFIHEGQSPKDVSIGRVKSRIRQLKGEECLEDQELKKWEYPPLLLRLANNFGNGIFGHARSFSDCARTVLDQRRYLDKGVVKTSGYDIVRELLGLDEQLQPTGSRRIFIDMTHLSASARNDLYQKIFRRFNKNVNPEHPIPVVFTEAAYSGVDYLAEMMKNAHERLESDDFRVQNYCGGSINLSDEDILEVFWSRGLISFSLEENKMGDQLGGIEKLFSNTPRAQALRLLGRQISGMISVPFAYHVTAPLMIWDYLNIGSGLTGKGERLERYRCNSYQNALEEDLEEVLTKLKKEEPMWFGSYKPEALVRKLCYQNISEFVLRNY